MRGYTITIEPSKKQLKRAFRAIVRKGAPRDGAFRFLGIFALILVLEYFDSDQATIADAVNSAGRTAMIAVFVFLAMDWLGAGFRARKEYAAWRNGERRGISLRDDEISLSAQRLGPYVGWDCLAHVQTEESINLYYGDGLWGALFIESIPLAQLGHEERMFLLDRLVHHNVPKF